jgi:transposase
VLGSSITVSPSTPAKRLGTPDVNASTPSENRSSNANPNELWKGELDLELTQFVALTVQLESVVKKLEALGKADPRIQRIRTIPGLGPRTAEIRVACIDDPHRFNNGREVSAYFGLVPRQYQSGETDRNGRITKRGNPSLIAPRRA